MFRQRLIPLSSVRAEASLRSRREGFSIIDACVVAALAGALLAMIVPTFTKIQSARKVQRAAIQLQGRLSACRVHAGAFQTSYDFHYEPNGRRYLILPAPAEEAPAARRREARSPGTPLSYWGELPEGIRFDRSSGQGSPVGLTAERLPKAVDEWASTVWSSPVRFAPDGSATGTYLVLVDSEGRLSQIQVHGANGIARVVRGGLRPRDS